MSVNSSKYALSSKYGIHCSTLWPCVGYFICLKFTPVFNGCSLIQLKKYIGSENK